MKCRICDSTDIASTVVAREMMFGMRDEFTYWECGRCGCLQIEKVPDLGKYYPQSYYSFQRDGFLKRAIRERWAAYSFDGSSPLIGRAMTAAFGRNMAVASVKSSGVGFDTAILDVGCGSGELLLLLRSLGFAKLTGADPFVESDIAYDNGVKVWKGTLDKMTGEFGLIMLHHAFEHMIDPVEVARQAARLLVKGGQLLIRVPVAGTAAWRQYGGRWVQLDAPRHIFLPTVKSMHILAERAGLRVRDVVFDSTEFQFWGSEQYARDIPLHDPRSMLPLRKRSLAISEMRRQRRAADALNAKRDGDQACFYLQKG